MSAIEQPAPKSGRRTCWWSGREDVGGFGHEMDAAENNVLGMLERRGVAGKLEGIADNVGKANDVVLLVVVAEDDEFFGEFGFALGDAGEEFGECQLGIGWGDGLLPIHEGSLGVL